MIQRLSLSLFLCSVVMVFFAFLPQPVSAQSLSDQVTAQLYAGTAKTQLTNEDPREVMVRAVRMFLSLVGTIFILLIFLGGFFRMTAQGDEEKVKKSTKIVVAAIIGLAVVIFSYAISRFLVQMFYGTAYTDSPYTTEQYKIPTDSWTIPFF